MVKQNTYKNGDDWGFIAFFNPHYREPKGTPTKWRQRHQLPPAEATQDFRQARVEDLEGIKA